MKRKKRLLSSVRLLIMSLLLICFVPISNYCSDFGTRLEVSGQRQLIDSSDIKGVQEDALDITEIAPNFTATVTSQNHSDTCQSYQITFRCGSSSGDFTLGYYGSEDDGLYLPFTVSYYVTTDDGEQIQRESEIEKSSTGNIAYQGLGDHFDTYISVTIDLFINPGDSIIDGSLVFYNVFEIATDGTNYYPGEQSYYIDSSEDYFSYSTAGSTNIDLTQYISASMDYVSTLGRYVSFTFTVHNNTVDLYTEQMSSSSAYETNQGYLARGTYSYQFTFTNMNSAYLLLAYEDDSMETVYVYDDYAQTTSFTVDEGDTVVHMLVENINLDGLTGVSLCSSSFKISIINNDTLAELNSSIYTTRFGSIYFEVEDDDFSNVFFHNVLFNLLIILFVFSAVYIAGIIVAYFYFSNKYKNDEFKRVQPKRFFKTNILGYLAVTVLLMDILIIVYRVGFIASALSTYNPLDNYIVCLSIIGIIFIGYFAKFFYLAIKNYLERRMKEKLQLDNDVEDDGTN